MSLGEHARRLDQLGRRRTKLDAAREELTDELRTAMHAARAAGMSPREIAERVGMSTQAVHRLYSPK